MKVYRGRRIQLHLTLEPHHHCGPKVLRTTPATQIRDSAKDRQRDVTKKFWAVVEEGPSPSNTRTAARLAQWWPHGTRRLTALSRCMAVTPLGARREPASTWWRYQDPASSAVPLSSSTTLEFKFQLRPRAEEFLNFISLKLIHDCTVHRVRQRVRN